MSLSRPEYVTAWMEGYEQRIVEEKAESEKAESEKAAARPANVIDFAACRAAKMKGGRAALRTSVKRGAR